MKALSMETLTRITDEFPTMSWPEGDLEELVAPKYGLITGFQDFLREVEMLQAIDLHEVATAGPLKWSEEP